MQNKKYEHIENKAKETAENDNSVFLNAIHGISEAHLRAE